MKDEARQESGWLESVAEMIVVAVKQIIILFCAHYSHTVAHSLIWILSFSSIGHVYKSLFNVKRI